VARRIVPVQPLRQVVRPALAAALSAGVEFGVVHLLPQSVASFVVAIAAGCAVYVVAICRMEGDVLRPVMRAVLPVRLQSPLARYLRGSVVAA
jgi:hypothetical protein